MSARSRPVEGTSAIDGGSVDLVDVFSSHVSTVLLFDGPTPTSTTYKTLVGIALEIAARWEDRVACYIVTRRTDRPFEIPCEAAILFDDRGELEVVFPGEAERVFVIDPQGVVALRLQPADATALMAHLTATLQR